MANAADRFWLVGNRVAVDFGNTVLDRYGGDGLTGWPDAVDFLIAARIVDPAEAERLAELAASDPARGAGALRLARDLRGAVRDVLSQLHARRQLEREPIERINGIMRLGQGHHAVVGDGHRWHIRFVHADPGPASALVPIARSIAEIVADPYAPEAVRKCAGDRCALYFYDTSRTGRRRWCSMAACGNRAKVAAHVRRRRDRAAQWRESEAAAGP
ncbi:MAG: CGNR zinc finger domain-containing protein [Candidatus Baltobacteraceae bacterium]|jgi:predicted RNA-binding Zn ribbon-like protein